MSYVGETLSNLLHQTAFFNLSVGNYVMIAVACVFLFLAIKKGFERGTAGRIFSALAHANINVRMIDQGSSELNIIIGVSNDDFDKAIKAIYDIFVVTQL